MRNVLYLMKRYRWLMAIVVTCLSIYVFSYVAFYHRGMRDVEQYGLRFFFYDSYANIYVVQDVTSQHAILSTLYYPIQTIHEKWLGGHGVSRGITFGFLRR